jgi:hypothetical protein
LSCVNHGPETLSLPLLQEADAPSLVVTSSSSAFHISIVKVLLILRKDHRSPDCLQNEQFRCYHRFRSVPSTAVVSHISGRLSRGFSRSFSIPRNSLFCGPSKQPSCFHTGQSDGLIPCELNDLLEKCSLRGATLTWPTCVHTRKGRDRSANQS